MASNLASATTEIQTHLRKCSRVEDSTARLRCYDGIATTDFSKKESNPHQTVFPERGKWQLTDRLNPIDDTKTITLTLTAESGRSRFGHPVRFVARCLSKKTDVYIVWSDFLGNDSQIVHSNWKDITYRIGQKPAVSQRWPVSTDSKATFAPNWAGQLLKAMLDETKFVAQVTPHGESPVTAAFDIRGLREVLRPLANTCGWSY
jgi:hypothetical protein